MTSRPKYRVGDSVDFVRIEGDQTFGTIIRIYYDSWANGVRVCLESPEHENPQWTMQHDVLGFHNAPHRELTLF